MLLFFVLVLGPKLTTSHLPGAAELIPSPGVVLSSPKALSVPASLSDHDGDRIGRVRVCVGGIRLGTELNLDPI